MKRVLASVTIAGAVLAIAFPSAPAQDKSPVEAAIGRGVKYLQDNHKDGMWQYDGTGTTLDIGTTALVGLALLECDVPKTDHRIVSAAASLRRSADRLNHTYSISLIIMFLDRLGEPRDVNLIKALSVRLIAGQGGTGGWTYQCPLLSAEHQKAWTDVMEKAKPKAMAMLADPNSPEEKPPQPALPQQPPGQPRPPFAPGTPPGIPPGARPPFPMPPGGPMGPGAFMGGGAPGDNSNTQFAILALWVGRRHGVPAEMALARVDRRFRKTQNSDGGWAYNPAARPQAGQPQVGQPPGEESTPTMTCAGLLGLAIAHGLSKDMVKQATLRATSGKDEGKPEPTRVEWTKDDAVLRARDYLARAMPDPKELGANPDYKGVRINPGDLYYYLWSLERVSLAYGWSEIGDKDWYSWGLDVALPRQDLKDGSWHGGYPGTVDTAFTLLFLRRKNLVSDLTARLGEANLTTAKNKPATPSPAVPRDVPEQPGRPAVERAPDADAEAAKLGKELVAADATRQAAILDRLQNAKGTAGKAAEGPYTQALADAIPKLKGDMQEKARNALADRMSRLPTKAIQDYLKSSAAELRRAAARGCGFKQDQDFTPDLIPLLSDADAAVVSAAYLALKEVTGKDFGKSPEPWNAWWKQQK